MGTLHEDLFTFLIIFLSILLKMRNISGERVNQNMFWMLDTYVYTHIYCM